MFVRLLMSALLLVVFVVPCGADEGKAPAPPTRAEIARTLRPSFVLVEFSLKRSNGDDPWYSPYNGQQLIALHAPETKAGVLVSDDTVVCSDIGLHPQFVAKIQVRTSLSASPVPAEIASYCVATNTIRVRLKRSLSGARALSPMRWKPKGKIEYAVRLVEHRGRHALQVIDTSVETTVFPDEEPAKREAAHAGLLVTAKGDPVSFGEALDAGEPGHPDGWKTFTRSALEVKRGVVQAHLGREVVRVQLTFCAPPRKDESQELLLEWSGLGLLLPQQRVLVFADFKAQVTARLKSIRVHGAKTVRGQFEVSLKRYGAFVAKLDQPLGEPASLDADLTRHDGSLAFVAGVRVTGEKRTDRVNRDRLSVRYVRLGSTSFAHTTGLGQFFTYGDPRATRDGMFVYSSTGQLLAVPIRFREGTPHEALNAEATAIADLRAKLTSLKGDHVDLTNRPLNDAEASRLAWLGVELQPLTPELARASKVLSRTNGGYNGGMVVHVYADSPASKAKLQDGDIIVSIRSDDSALLPVELNRYAYGEHTRFPWKELDQCSDEYFEHLPKPWPPVETPITRALTDLGFGKVISVEFARDGVVQSVRMVITPGPTDFATAARVTSKRLGVTVADMTYEVRRVLRRKAKSPGVVVAKIERGSTMSVAGLKPYEVVTHINEQPIRVVADFTKAVAQGGALRFSIKRLHLGRIVKVTLPKRTPVTKVAEVKSAKVKTPPVAAPTAPTEWSGTKPKAPAKGR